MRATQALRTDRLDLCALDPLDAEAMVAVLGDSRLYVFTGGEPPSREALHARYRAQVAGSGLPDETWHNWILRLDGVAVGFVQATVVGDTADLAWLIGIASQGLGLAKEAAAAMCDWLVAAGVGSFTAHIHPDHIASAAVAATLGLRDTGEIDGDGESIWRSPTA